jgi:hypothetical protein
MATDTYKVLYQNDLPNTASPSALYTPGSGKMGIIKNIKLYNHGANSETVRWFINGTNANNRFANLTLTAAGSDGSQMEWDGTIALNNADAIYANTTDSTAVACIITGDEVS